MTRYFLHLRNQSDIVTDLEGREFESDVALKAAMLAQVREFMKSDIENGCLDLRLRIDAETVSGQAVQSLAFTNALEIIYPAPEHCHASA